MQLPVLLAVSGGRSAAAVAVPILIPLLIIGVVIGVVVWWRRSNG